MKRTPAIREASASRASADGGVVTIQTYVAAAMEAMRSQHLYP